MEHQLNKRSILKNHHKHGNRNVYKKFLQLTRIKRNNDIFRPRSFMYIPRQRRNQNEDAELNYLKYIDKIRQKHRNYISNLFRMSHNLVKNNSTMEEMDSLRHGHNPSERINAHRTVSSQSVNYPTAWGLGDNRELIENYPLSASTVHRIEPVPFMPIPLPNINQGLNFPYTKKESHPELPIIVNNTYLGNNWQLQLNNNVPNMPMYSNNFFDLPDLHGKQRNNSNIISQLKSQILQRRKRDTTDELNNEKVHRKNGRRFNLNQTQLQENGDEPTDNDKKAKTREPCEVSFLYL